MRALGDGDQVYKLAFTRTPKELGRAVRLRRRAAGSVRREGMTGAGWIVAGVATLGVARVLVSHFGAGSQSEELVGFWGFFISGVLIWSGVVVATGARHRLTLARYFGSHDELFTSVAVTIGADGYQEDGASPPALIRWPKFDFVGSSDDLLVLTYSGDTALFVTYLPRRAIDEQARWIDLVHFVEERVDSRPMFPARRGLAERGPLR